MVSAIDCQIANVARDNIAECLYINMINIFEKIVTMVYYHCHNRWYDQDLEYGKTIFYLSSYTMIIYNSCLHIFFPRLPKLSAFYIITPFVATALCIFCFFPKKKLDTLMTELTNKEKRLAKSVFWGAMLFTGFFFLVSEIIQAVLYNET